MDGRHAGEAIRHRRPVRRGHAIGGHTVSDTPPERRVDDRLTVELITQVSALRATSEATLRQVADGQAAIRTEIAATREVLVEKMEGGDKDSAAIARILGVQVADVVADVAELKPRVAKLETWQGRIAGALALIVVLVPIFVVVLQHVWHQ